MRINFMLIDDNEIDLFVCQRMIELELGNQDIAKYDNAQSALDDLLSLTISKGNSKAEMPHIIILDINMPGLNGFGFLDGLSELKKSNRLPVKTIVLSSTTKLEYIMNAEKHEACDGFIGKPLTGLKIRQIVGAFKPEPDNVDLG